MVVEQKVGAYLFMGAFHFTWEGELTSWAHACVCTLQGIDSYNTTSVTNFVMATNYTGVWCLA